VKKLYVSGDVTERVEVLNYYLQNSPSQVTVAPAFDVEFLTKLLLEAQ